MVKYFSYASNSTLNGICTVNKELSEMLMQVASVAGFDGDANEWLKMCVYYEAFGPNGTQLQDPIKGLSTFSAFETVVGKDVETNCFYYDRAIIPRGLLSEFVPDRSGVYRFTSKSDYADGIDAWIFNENGEVIYTYEHDEECMLMIKTALSFIIWKQVSHIISTWRSGMFMQQAIFTMMSNI